MRKPNITSYHCNVDFLEEISAKVTTPYDKHATWQEESTWIMDHGSPCYSKSPEYDTKWVQNGYNFVMKTKSTLHVQQA